MMGLHRLTALCGLLSIGTVIWFLTVCAGALDAEHGRVTRR